MTGSRTPELEKVGDVFATIFQAIVDFFKGLFG